MTTYSVALSANKQTDITVEEYGGGHPFLLMHGGAGPQSMIALPDSPPANMLTSTFQPTRVLVAQPAPTGLTT